MSEWPRGSADLPSRTTTGVFWLGETLHAAGVWLPLDPTGDGPLVATGHDGFDSLGWFLNMAVLEPEQDAIGRLRRGEPVGWHEGPRARPLGEFDSEGDRAAGRARFHCLSGRWPGRRAWMIRTGWSSPPVLVPRRTLLALVHELTKLRAAYCASP